MFLLSLRAGGGRWGGRPGVCGEMILGAGPKRIPRLEVALGLVSASKGRVHNKSSHGFGVELQHTHTHTLTHSHTHTHILSLSHTQQWRRRGRAGPRSISCSPIKDIINASAKNPVLLQYFTWVSAALCPSASTTHARSHTHKHIHTQTHPYKPLMKKATKAERGDSRAPRKNQNQRQRRGRQ